MERSPLSTMTLLMLVSSAILVDGSTTHYSPPLLETGVLTLTNEGYFAVTISYFVPAYLPLNQPIIIRDRVDAAVYTSQQPQLFIAVKIACGNIKRIIKTLALNLKTGSQEMTIEAVVPSTLLDALTCSPANLYLVVYQFVVHGLRYGSEASEHGQVTPVKVYLVKYNPVVVVESRTDALDLIRGETKRLEFTITPLNGSIYVKNILVQPPGFVTVVSTPGLPVYIDSGQRFPFAVTLKGVSPGAGVVSIRVVYGTALEERYADLLVPVIVSFDDVRRLIAEYRNSVETYVGLLNEIARTYGSVDEVRKAIEIAYWLRERVISLSATSSNLAEELGALKSALTRLSGHTNASLALLERRIVDSTTQVITEIALTQTQLRGEIEGEVAGLRSRLQKLNESVSSVSRKVEDYLCELNDLRSGVGALRLLVASALALTVVIITITVMLLKRTRRL